MIWRADSLHQYRLSDGMCGLSHKIKQPFTIKNRKNMQQDTLTNVPPVHSGVARMMDACYHRQPDTTPVWFMRQAGRCLADYRELRKRYDILTMAKTPDLCAQVTLMPVQQLGVDGAVLYADIMLPLEGMGVSLEIQPDLGPVIHHPIRTMQDVEKLLILEAEESTPY